MSATIDGLKVVWDAKERRFLCAGHGYAFAALINGAPPHVEAEVFTDSDPRRAQVAYLLTPAPDWPDVPPSEEDVARVFSAQLRRQLAARTRG